MSDRFEDGSEVKSEKVEGKSKKYRVRKKKGLTVSASFASHFFLLTSFSDSLPGRVEQ